MPGSLSYTEQAVVVLAKVTMKVPVSADGLALRPATMPAFNGRDAWVMLWQGGPHSCPVITSPGPGGPEPQPVEIIAADGSGEGVSYQTGGSFCAEPVTGPTATPAVYQESLPWTQESSTPTGLTIAYTSPRAECRAVDSPASTGSSYGLGRRHGRHGRRAVSRRQARSGDRSVGGTAGTRSTHGKTGLLVGRSTGGFKPWRISMARPGLCLSASDLAQGLAGGHLVNRPAEHVRRRRRATGQGG